MGQQIKKFTATKFYKILYTVDQTFQVETRKLYRRVPIFRVAPIAAAFCP